MTKLIIQRGGGIARRTSDGIPFNATRLLMLGLLLIAGCQRSDKVGVSGRVVRHDGSPLKGATVIARSDETGKWAKGTTDADGKYELGAAVAGEGIAPGDYRVVIMEDLGDGGLNKPTVPAKYVSPTTSKLQLTVAKGKKIVFDIKLDPS